MGRLVINRRVDETVYVGDTISVTVAEIQRGQVKLVIEAPATIPILREEIALEAERKRK